MATARCAEPADQIRARVVLRGMAAQPANAVVDLGHGQRVLRVGRHAEVERGNHNAVRREVGMDRFVLQTIVRRPHAAVYVDDGGKRTLAFGFVDPSEQRAIAGA